MSSILQLDLLKNIKILKDIGLKIKDLSLKQILVKYWLMYIIFNKLFLLCAFNQIGFIESYLDPLKVRAEF